jgi:hypothetical protein
MLIVVGLKRRWIDTTDPRRALMTGSCRCRGGKKSTQVVRQQ